MTESWSVVLWGQGWECGCKGASGNHWMDGNLRLVVLVVTFVNEHISENSSNSTLERCTFLLFVHFTSIKLIMI